MAQNEVQKYQSAQDFYNNVRNVLETFYNVHDKLEKMANFLNSADAATYTDIPAETLTALGNLRIETNTFLAAAETVGFVDEVKKFVRI